MNESPLPGHHNVDTSPENRKELEVSTSPVTVESGVNFDEGKGNFPPVFSEKSKGLWEKLTKGGKEIAGWVSEKIQGMPIVGRLVGKAQILYHFFWMNKHNEKAETLKSKIGEVEEKIAQMAASEKQIADSLEKLKSLNTSGMDSVEEKLRHIQMNKENLITSRDKYKGKLEERNEKMKSSLEKRDAVVDKFISRSREKLEKISGGIEDLKEKRKAFETKASFEEIVNKSKVEELNTKLAMKDQIVSLS